VLATSPTLPNFLNLDIAISFSLFSKIKQIPPNYKALNG